MTEKAIELLSANPKGYFLLVEGTYKETFIFAKNIFAQYTLNKGGNIDLAHHAANARRALDDFVAFDEAIGRAKSLVNLDETLLVVTADHSHT